ncbi:hypothetical protein [Rhodobacter sp. 24-YEA-8]|uniref:hypothetical protein n=1 Tax=Rhodobacter sp. 24-YEA-8 TaxID=1884310 RepID=UPI001C0BF735|nr:hypothetical protein [Rhodobacter sp. 24-YEA-8]
MIHPPLNSGFLVLPTASDIRVSRCYLPELRRRPLSPLALHLRESVLAGGVAGTFQPLPGGR